MPLALAEPPRTRPNRDGTRALLSHESGRLAAAAAADLRKDAVKPLCLSGCCKRSAATELAGLGQGSSSLASGLPFQLGRNHSRPWLAKPPCLQDSALYMPNMECLSRATLLCIKTHQVAVRNAFRFSIITLNADQHISHHSHNKPHPPRAKPPQKPPLANNLHISKCSPLSSPSLLPASSHLLPQPPPLSSKPAPTRPSARRARASSNRVPTASGGAASKMLAA